MDNDRFRKALDELRNGEVYEETVQAFSALLAAKEKVEAERDEALDVKLNRMRLENGNFDMSVAGPAMERTATLIGGWFAAGGAKNYVEMRLHDMHETGHVYVLTIQKAGGETPAEQLAKARADLAAEKERRVSAEKALSPFVMKGGYGDIDSDAPDDGPIFTAYSIADQSAGIIIRRGHFRAARAHADKYGEV